MDPDPDPQHWKKTLLIPRRKNITKKKHGDYTLLEIGCNTPFLPTRALIQPNGHWSVVTFLSSSVVFLLAGKGLHMCADGR
jgi:hypothetical protein